MPGGLCFPWPRGPAPSAYPLSTSGLLVFSWRGAAGESRARSGRRVSPTCAHPEPLRPTGPQFSAQVFCLFYFCCLWFVVFAENLGSTLLIVGFVCLDIPRTESSQMVPNFPHFQENGVGWGRVGRFDLVETVK